MCLESGDREETAACWEDRVVTVVTPYTIGGQRMALGLLQPTVNEFLNSVAFDAEKHTELGEIEVREHSEFIGETLRESRLRERWGAIVVAIKHQGGEFILSPSADTVKYKKRKPA